MIHRPTLIAIALVAYALANIVHECIGHGGTCVFAGAHLQVLSAVHAECDTAGAGRYAAPLVTAAGTIANLIAAAIAWLALRARRGTTLLRYFLWLFATINLLQATGYWLFSGLGNIGDWAALVRGLEPHWLYRVVLTIAGALGYRGAVGFALRTLNPMLGAGDERLARARTLAKVPYFAGGVLYVAAGVLNPVSPLLVVISAAAASFGGTSGLAWMSERQRGLAPASEPPITIARSMPWQVAAAIVTLVFVVVLGPGVRF